MVPDAAVHFAFVLHVHVLSCCFRSIVPLIRTSFEFAFCSSSHVLNYCAGWIVDWQSVLKIPNRSLTKRVRALAEPEEELVAST